LGSARTAFYNWLYARHCDGRFLLRFEDTDRERSTEAAVEVVLEGMAWLGLDYDDGPYYQTRRFERYAEVIDRLIESGSAYYCYCGRDRLDRLRQEQMASGQKPRYDGHCRDARSHGRGKTSPVVRFRTPTDGVVNFNDQVRGAISIQNNELDDLILARADGSPTYNLAAVIDDIDMGITHVIRGEDHLNNTPRQIHIVEAMGARRPTYAHIPMINGSDGKKLSKRHGATSVLQYRDDGFLPQALLNYLARLGWSYGDQEVFSREEMVEKFDAIDINKSAANFDLDKLMWVNQQYIQMLPMGELVARARPFFVASGIELEESDTIEDVVDAQRSRVKTLIEMAEKSRPFFGELTDFDKGAAKKYLRPVSEAPLRDLLGDLEKAESWDVENLQSLVEKVAVAHDLKLGKIAQPLRVALTGSAASPSIYITLHLIGREQCLKRLEHALAYIEARIAAS